MGSGLCSDNTARQVYLCIYWVEGIFLIVHGISERLTEALSQSLETMLQISQNQSTENKVLRGHNVSFVGPILRVPVHGIQQRNVPDGQEAEIQFHQLQQQL